MPTETSNSHCRHGVRFPHECMECKNEVTREEVKLLDTVAYALLPHLSRHQSALKIASAVVAALQEITPPQEPVIDLGPVPEPVEYQFRHRYLFSGKQEWSEWDACTKDQYEAWSCNNDKNWEYEVRKLYMHPNPVEVNLDAAMWARIKQSASKSAWMPAEYTMNDWVSDICQYLEQGVVINDGPI